MDLIVSDLMELLLWSFQNKAAFLTIERKNQLTFLLV